MWRHRCLLAAYAGSDPEICSVSILISGQADLWRRGWMPCHASGSGASKWSCLDRVANSSEWGRRGGASAVLDHLRHFWTVALGSRRSALQVPSRFLDEAGGVVPPATTPRVTHFRTGSLYRATDRLSRAGSSGKGNTYRGPKCLYASRDRADIGAHPPISEAQSQQNSRATTGRAKPHRRARNPAPSSGSPGRVSAPSAGMAMMGAPRRSRRSTIAPRSSR